MNLIKFTEESPDEALCKAHFRAQREQEGLTYRKCGGTHQILARRQAMGQRDDLYNLKRNLLGLYHKIKGAYLQKYLNEFCYKRNRIYFRERLFNRLIIAAANG